MAYSEALRKPTKQVPQMRSEKRLVGLWPANRHPACTPNRAFGWRIDYQIATTGTANLAKSAVVHDRFDRFSDHAPLIVDYDIKL